jgi:ABC-type sulfate transport system substrate-binding protein
VPVLDSGARGATTTFVSAASATCCWPGRTRRFSRVKELGPDKFEIVRPRSAILAEPPVAVVDKVVDKRAPASGEAYLEYLYSPEGRTSPAKHFYRPRPGRGRRPAPAVPEGEL